MAGLPQDPMEQVLSERGIAALDAILLKFNQNGVAKPSRIVYLVPGDSIVWDSACGQLTCRLDTLVPHSTNKTARLTACSIDYWVATLEITYLQCVSALDDSGKAPSGEKITEDGLAIAKSMRLMLEALTALKNDEGDSVWSGPPSWQPNGPNGGMGGITWKIPFQIDATPC